MELKVDLHMHTSEDQLDRGFIKYSALELIDIVKEKGFDAVSITNHDSITDITELKEYADKSNIILISGIEKTIEGKHIVFLNADEDKMYDLKTFEDIKNIKRKETLIIAPHPFFPHRNSINSDLERYVEYFDAIEYTGLYFKYINFSEKSKKFASRYCLPIVGSSDAHSEIQIGLTYTIIESERNVDSIINAIKSNKVRLMTNPLPVNFESIFLASEFVYGAIRSVFE